MHVCDYYEYDTFAQDRYILHAMLIAIFGVVQLYPVEKHPHPKVVMQICMLGMSLMRSPMRCFLVVF